MFLPGLSPKLCLNKHLDKFGAINKLDMWDTFSVCFSICFFTKIPGCDKNAFICATKHRVPEITYLLSPNWLSPIVSFTLYKHFKTNKRVDSKCAEAVNTIIFAMG